MNTDCDILVIGAGAAGLSCARELIKAGKRVIALEARDRAGGRVHTIRERGVVEAGAEFVHGEHAVTWDYIREKNLRTEEWLYEKRVFGEKGIRDDSSEVLLVMNDVLDDEKHGGSTTGTSVAQEIMKRNAPADASFYALRSAGDLEGADPEKIDAALLIRQEGRASAGHHNFWITDGYDMVIGALAEGLDIRLSHTVSRIEHEPDKVRVTCADGSAFTARKVVLTVSIGVLRSSAIEFVPALPAPFIDAVRRVGFGNSTKLTLWLRGSLPRFGMLDTPGLFGHFWPRLWGEEGVLVGFSGGSRADTLSAMTEQEAVDAGLDELTEALGVDIRRQVVHARHFTWSDDPFVLGSYTFDALGSEGAREILGAPIMDTLYYTGEATNTHGHTATVHGAIEAGRDTARLILES